MNRPTAIRAAAVDQLALRPEALAWRTILSLISSLVDVTVFIHFSENTLHSFHVIIVRRPDKTVIGDIHQFPQVQDSTLSGNNPIHKFLRCHSGFLGLLFNLLAVFICTRQKHDIVARQAFVTGNGVSGNRTVGMADMQFIRWIINRCSNIKGGFGHVFSPFGLFSYSHFSSLISP